MPKLKQKDLKKFREDLLKKQNGSCSLCGTPVTEDAVLDHDHKTGRVRATLHRHCNAALGKVENYVLGYGKHHFLQEEVLEGFLKGLLEYMSMDYGHMPYHPKHKTPLDKEKAKLKKRIKAAKMQATKDRLQQQLKELEQIDE